MIGSEQRDITPEAILAFLDGEDLPHVAAYLRSSPEGAMLAAEYATVAGGLTRALYRHDCPPTQQLGDYALGLLPPADRFAVAAHADDCPRCADELAQIRAFLTIEADPPPLTPLDRARRLVATLLAPPLAPAGAALRGDAADTALTYQAGEHTITLDQFATGRRGRRNLVGLLVGPTPPADGAATLTAADGVILTEPIDAGGNFAFDDLSAGDYQLEVRLGEECLAIDGLRVGD